MGMRRWWHKSRTGSWRAAKGLKEMLIGSLRNRFLLSYVLILGHPEKPVWRPRIFRELLMISW